MAHSQTLTEQQHRWPALTPLDGVKAAAAPQPLVTTKTVIPDSVAEHSDVALLVARLRQRGLQVYITDGVSLPPEAAMHDRAAPIPAIVVSPVSEYGVSETLRLLKVAGLYGRLPVSVKSGGHGYFNGASCDGGLMINLAGMTKRRVAGDVLHIEPGCVLGQTIHTLATAHKAVPHGDCFGVGAGGHFLTAGWDLILGRKHGLGCQSVVGGRIVLWDGTVVDVSEESHPELLHAMRGGAAAGAGVVIEIRLRVMEEPARATWRFTRITRGQLERCAAQGAFRRAYGLPRDVSVSFRFHFEADQVEPVASLNVVSLLSAGETVALVREHMGAEVAALVDGDMAAWSEKTLLDLRMLPASDFLAANPGMLGEVTATALHADPLLYWKPTSSAREMASSYFTSVSNWVVPECEDALLRMYDLFHSVRHSPARSRMYALVIQGGGAMTDMQASCSMPLGSALARFELHWDDPEEDERWSRRFTDKVLGVMGSVADPSVSRPYRGDIWLASQARDAELDRIFKLYDRRFA
ncbi:hypothetical protein MCOR27_003820 [Pyricularia oryzae]|nr:hypothetical protein MCOR01_000068 [Pyricularia oryzae]KAI6282230.1 hypothetical protein MCOR27_003820 [Pyricularia oryzae]KAI6409709.1 hypothetical protein MCOR23_000798 [Pyricularia oryzae]KAI6413756.1 hypothetical protein MCOR20_002672 [Pyricularia oryzae]KAI6442586.1 hypothetical protein MCOR22_005855 [Pyricularia oryzae]